MGAYGTITNVPANKFGEGSFDKGIFLSIPLDWSLGVPSPNKETIEFNVMTRDGGAKLNVPYRLYDLIHHSQSNSIYREAGRFWK